MGSGELAPAMLPVHRAGIEAAGAEAVVVMDSPFGFQENAPHLTRRLTDFFRSALGVAAVVASYPSGAAGPGARERFKSTVAGGRYVFAGPGSPSYALDRWRESDAAAALGTVLAAGGTVTLASAAALTAGRWTIPVYEIYKVGADPFWLDGLDLTGAAGLPLAVVPHWNNREGGDHDTSHCYIGARRFGLLADRIQGGVLGIDEHTAATIDFGAETLEVAGRGRVTVQGREQVVLEAGDSMPLSRLGDLVGAVAPRPLPTPPPPSGVEGAVAAGGAEALLDALVRLAEAGDLDRLRPALVSVVEAARVGLQDPRERVADLVALILEWRAEARRTGDFETADRIRRRLGESGVEVRDLADGVEWELLG